MATNASQEAWFASAPGTYMNPDGAYGYQCVDVADHYAQHLFGNWAGTIGGGNANQLFPAKNPQYFTSIRYTGSNRPERGDIVVWGGDGMNPYGHIAVVMSSTHSMMTVVQQNVGGTADHPARVDDMPYSGASMGTVVGWLRPNVPGATIPDPGEVLSGGTGGGMQTGGSSTATEVRQANQRIANRDTYFRDAPSPGAAKTAGTSTTASVADGEHFIADGMDWDQLAFLESGSRWNCNTGNGFYGGLQFTYTTWLEFGGGKYAERADYATREQQIEIARAVLKGQGVMAWPNTGPKCYDPNRPDSGGTTTTSTSGSDIKKGAKLTFDGFVLGEYCDGSSFWYKQGNAYAPFMHFDPKETTGLKDITAYNTWKVVIPEFDDLKTDWPETYESKWDWSRGPFSFENVKEWDGMERINMSSTGTHEGVYTPPTYMGGSGNQPIVFHQYDLPHAPVKADDVSPEIYSYLVNQAGWTPSVTPSGAAAAVPPASPVGPVDWGDVDEETWNHLINQLGWYGVATDGAERIYPPGYHNNNETTSRFNVPSGPVEWGQVDEDTWYYLRDTLGWYGIAGDGAEKLYPPSYGHGATVDVTYGEFYVPTVPVLAGQVSDAMWNMLRALGWTGRADDPQMRLYPPDWTGPAIEQTRYFYDLPTQPIAPGSVSAELWTYLLEHEKWTHRAGEAAGIIYPPRYTGPFGVAVPYTLPEIPLQEWQVSPALQAYLLSAGWNLRTRSGFAYTGSYSRTSSLEGATAGVGEQRGMEIKAKPLIGAVLSQNDNDGVYGSWRYIAQRATTGEWLEWDLPLDREELTWELSGPGSLRGKVGPDTGALRAHDGRLLLEEWGTIIYAEADGEIRWGGIVINSTFNGESWEIECAGFSSYPHGIPYSSVYSGIGVDPAQVFAHVWEHVQSFADGYLGVTVTEAKTGLRIGLPKSPVTKSEVSNDLWLYLLNHGWGNRPGDTTRIYPPDYDGDVPPAEGSTTSDTHEPYELLWWDAPDCGKVLDDMAQQGPFDYVERHGWDGKKERVLHEVQICYPRTGRRREDLVFIQGDNVIEIDSPVIPGDSFANEVLGIGAGEGEGALRRQTATRDGRLRRVSIVSAKDLAQSSELDRIIDAELRRHQIPLEINSIRVRTHPNAPIGSWALGDDILVQGKFPWLGEVSLWCRIVGWSLDSDSEATLQLARSDSFTYAATSTTNPNEGPGAGPDGPATYPGDDTFPSKTTYPND